MIRKIRRNNWKINKLVKIKLYVIMRFIIVTDYITN